MRRFTYLLIFSACLILFNLQSFGQADSNITKPKYRTLFNNNGQEPAVSGMFAFHLDLGQYKNSLTNTSQPSLNLGGEMAVILNKVFYMGFYGRGMVSFPEKTFSAYNLDSSKNYEFSTNAFFGHGGMVFGGIVMPNSPIHLALSMKIGGGDYTLVNDGFNFNSDEYFNNSWSIAPVLVLTPQVDVEMNITHWFRFKLGAGYQWVSSANKTVEFKDANNQIVNKEIMNTKELNNLYFSVGFVFGWFK